MRFVFTLASAVFAFTSLTAKAEIISVRDVVATRAPTIMRGAPVRCHGSQPVVIKVRSSIKRAQSAKSNCVTNLPIAAEVVHVTNIVIIARRHERVYINFN